MSRRPPTAELRLFTSSRGTHAFVVDGSRIYDLDPDTAARVGRSLETADAGAASDAFRLFDIPVGDTGRRIDGRPLRPPPLHALSLNVAQACNMSCHYCYADAGTFGGRARTMSPETAEAAVDNLIRESEPGASLVLGFMGGEPLLNRAVVHHATRYAARRAVAAGRHMRFSITTNGTVITPDDVTLFTRFPFSVQISIDGSRAVNDAARPMNNGSSSYERILEGLHLFASVGRPRLLAARVTVTPRTGDLLPILEHLLGLGFDEVGFAAVLVSPSPAHAFAAADFPMFLARMLACGEYALARLVAGEAARFANFETALREIHRGSHRPYPCGAGAAYLSANADGELFACHRLVDDARFAMGDIREGSDVAARAAHLARSHVDRMEPCRDCWARYLCGGGCYHEVSRRGRPGCDYIRGWLEFCLSAYVEVSELRPEFFSAPTKDPAVQEVP